MSGDFNKNLYILLLRIPDLKVNQARRFWVNVDIPVDVLKEFVMSHIRKVGILSGLAAAAVVLTGCVVAPAPYYQSRAVVMQPGVSVSANVEYVQTAPPAPYNEVVTVSPGVGFVWTPGLWYWSGGRHVWRAGAWARPPVGYNTWNSGGWYNAPGRGWYHSGGHWR